MTKIHFIKDLIIQRRMQTHMYTHMRTHRMRSFSDEHNRRQPCNLAVNTNKLPVWTFLYFFVLTSLEWKLTMSANKWGSFTTLKKVFPSIGIPIISNFFFLPNTHLSGEKHLIIKIFLRSPYCMKKWDKAQIISVSSGAKTYSLSTIQIITGKTILTICIVQR